MKRLALVVLAAGALGGCGDVVVAYRASSTGASSSGTGPGDSLPDYVAVGLDSEMAVTFDDGRTWTEIRDQAPTDDVLLEGSTRGEDRVVVVGGFATLYSTDGLNWETFGDELGYARAVAYGNGTFVSVGLDRRARSSDAVGWIDERRGELGFDYSDIVYGDGRFVAVGFDVMGTSTDGVSWTTRTLTGPKVSSIAYGNERFVAVGEEGRVLITLDGVDVESDELLGPYFDAVCFYQGEFVALANSVVRVSEFGVEWVEFSVPTSYALACGPASMVSLHTEVIHRGDDIGSLEVVHATGAPLSTVEYTGEPPSE